MLDIGWAELMVIGTLALIVVGPKELPRLLRTVGQFVGKARGIAREFQRSMEDAAREADLKELTDLKRDVEKVGKVDFKAQAKKSSESLMSGGKKADTAAEKSENQAMKAAKAGPSEKAPEPAKPVEPAKPAAADKPAATKKPAQAKKSAAAKKPAKPAKAAKAAEPADPPRAASGDR